MEQIGYQIVHSIAGRIRIRVPWLETDEQAASKYQRLLEALSYVSSVRINSLAKSIVIAYNAKQLEVSEAEELFIAAMQQVKLTPPMQVTTIETEPAPNSAPSQEPASKTPAPQQKSEPVQEPVNEKPAPPPKESAIPEIPSPWDEQEKFDQVVANEIPLSGLEPSQEQAESMSLDREEPDVQSFPTAELIEQSIEMEPSQGQAESMALDIEKSDVLSSPVAAELTEQGESTASLARRLRVTSQAITRRRTKADFAAWTQAQDPDKTAWRYDEATRSFYPLNSLTEPEQVLEARLESIEKAHSIDEGLEESVGLIVREPLENGENADQNLTVQKASSGKRKAAKSMAKARSSSKKRR